MILRNRIYYRLKPLLPLALRLALRRRHVRRIRNNCASVWPINESAAKKPHGWPGWPGGKQFAVVLTHDVEGSRGLERVRLLAELEMDLGFRSSFNFIPEGEYKVPAELRHGLKEYGFEVGVHDLEHDGRLYRSRKDFRKKAARINRYLKEWDVTGFRSGFMLHKLDWLHDLNIAYDASTFDTDPFEPQPDGVGTIFPFWVPKKSSSSSSLPAPRSGPNSDLASPISSDGYVELPYTLVQDSTLFLFLGEQTIDCWKRKLDWIAAHGGMVLLNVHPDYVNFQDRYTEEEFPAFHYRELLAYLKDRYGEAYWHALPKEVAAFTRQNRLLHRLRSPRRICMLAHTFYESDGRVIRYAESLARSGEQVEVLALYSPDRPLPPNERNGVSVTHILRRSGNHGSRVDHLWQLVRFLIKANLHLIARQFRRPYDLIHVHNIPDFLVFATWLHKLCGGRVILDIHDVVPELFANKFGANGSGLLIESLKLTEKLSCAFSDHVIIANHLWLDKVTSRSVTPERCTAIINNVDTGIFRPCPRPRPDDRQIMIFPGTLQWHQGLDIAIEGIDLLREELPRLNLHVYGSGQALPDLIRQVERLDLRERVRFFPGRPLEEIVPIVAAADIGIVPKRSDSFGNEAYSTKIMEFMALGVPAVVSRTKIDDFYFNDDVVAFFEPQNPADLARVVKRVLTEGSYRDRLVENARRYVRDNSWETVQQGYLNLVDRLLAD